MSYLVLPGAEGIVPTEKSSSGVQDTVVEAQDTLRVQLREGGCPGDLCSISHPQLLCLLKS